MVVHPSELLAEKAVEALYAGKEHLKPAPEGLGVNISTAIDMLREGEQPFLHVGRKDRGGLVNVVRGSGELGGGIWPLDIADDYDADINPVGLQLKNVSASVVTLSGAIDPEVRDVDSIERESIVVGLGSNVIVDGEDAHDEIEQALENMDWLISPDENVLVVGNSAMNGFLFGATYSQHRPAIAGAIHEHFQGSNTPEAAVQAA